MKLEQHAHEFFHIVSKMFDVNAIVMLIDDVDMAFDKGFDVLEVVRKYLASPYLIPIVAGDMKLYREIVETKFMEKIDFYKDVSAYNQMKNIFEKGCSDDRQVTKSWDTSKLGCDHELLIQNRQELKDKKHLANHLVEQYLRKIFPNEYHIKLKDIFTIIKENKVQVRLKDNLEVPYTEIKDFEIRHINLGINQVQFTYQIFSNNTRDLVQYLFAKKDIYSEFFTKIIDKYPKEAIHKKYIPQNVIDKYDNDIFQYIFKDTMLYKKSLEITSNIYEYCQDKQKELSKLAENDAQAFDGKKYNIYKAFTGHVFESSKLDTEKSKEHFALYYTSDDKTKKLEDMDKFIVDLFVHANYYTQKNETKRYIFAGKFIELMFFSLQLKVDLNINNINREKYPEFFIDSKENDDKKYDWISTSFHDSNREVESFNNNAKSINTLINYFNLETISLRENEQNILDEISYSIPFNSIFKKNKNYEALTDNSVQNDDNDILGYISHNEDFLLALTKEIAIWRSVCIEDVKINSISMYEIIHKFFNNLNLLKEQRLAEERPILFLQRIVFIFINAVAFFENTNIRVAQTNIAMAEKFEIGTPLKKTNAYNQNIKPLLHKKSLTKALFFHPIISKILSNSSMLDNYRFVERKAVREVFESLIKDIKSFGIDQKNEVLEKVLKLDKQDIQEISEIDKFKKSVISASKDKNTEKQNKFLELKQQLEDKIK